MELSELKRRESELRKKLGDERYEKIYMQQQRIEAMRDRTAYKRQGAGGDTENMFYADGPDSGIIPNKPSIADYRRGIDALSAKIADMGKMQYEYMLSGDDGKVSVLDSAIKNAEKQREELKNQMSLAMGIGSESKDKDMLRARRTAGEKLFFGAGDYMKAIGLEDEVETVPLPLKVPGTFNDYINEEDLNNPKDRFKELIKNAKLYYQNGDEAGLKQFYHENRVSESLQRAIDDIISNPKIGENQVGIKAPDADKIILISEDGGFRKIGADSEEYRREKAKSQAIEGKIIQNATNDVMLEDIEFFHYMYDNVVAQQIDIKYDIPGQPKGENYGRMKNWYKADTEYILTGWNDGDNKAEIYVYYGNIDESTGKETITREPLNSIVPAELWFVWDETDPEACFENLLKDTIEMGMERLGQGNIFSPRGQR